MQIVQTNNAVGRNVGEFYADQLDEQIVGMFLHGRSDNTVRKYGYDLSTFFAWLDGRSFRDVNLQDLQHWTLSLTGAPKSKRERIATIRSFYSWSLKLGIVRLNPAAALEVPKVREAMHERILTDADRNLITENTKTLRDRALLTFAFTSGARVSELCGLRVKDLRFKPDGSVLVSIYRSKTNTTTVQPYPATSTVCKMLSQLVENRSKDDYVFRSNGVPDNIKSTAGKNKDGQLDTSAVWRIVRAAVKRSGLDVPVSPHFFRHACATHLVQRETNLHNVAQWMGHNSIQTTMRYVHLLGENNLSHHFED
jgi:integrase/recombinase XerD